MVMYAETAAMQIPGAGETAPEVVGFAPEHYLNTYGLADSDLNQTVTFGGHQGTVREMLDDAACPIGARVAETFREDGFGGVEKFFGGLAVMGANVTISGTTRAYHAGEISRDELLGPRATKGNTDFLG